MLIHPFSQKSKDYRKKASVYLKTKNKSLFKLKSTSIGRSSGIHGDNLSQLVQSFFRRLQESCERFWTRFYGL